MPIESSKKYHFASESFFYNNWFDLDQITGYGQKNQILRSNPRKFSYINEVNSFKEIEKEIVKSNCADGKINIEVNEPFDTYNFRSIDGKQIMELSNMNQLSFEINNYIFDDQIVLLTYQNKDKFGTIKFYCR